MTIKLVQGVSEVTICHGPDATAGQFMGPLGDNAVDTEWQVQTSLPVGAEVGVPLDRGNGVAVVELAVCGCFATEALAAACQYEFAATLPRGSGVTLEMTDGATVVTYDPAVVQKLSIRRHGRACLLAYTLLCGAATVEEEE